MKHTLFNIVKYTFIWLLSVIIPLISVHAEVIVDGTLGDQININGPDYRIQPEYGKQAGTNLFHSFEQFNIKYNESADFIVPDNIVNIIGRVTGGNPSHIDGIIRSTLQGTNAISNANLFLLNPSGILFSKNASLEIGGSFHVSTADYLRLEGNDIFYSIPIESEMLSISAPQAFGFINNDIGDISFEGKGEILAEEYHMTTGLHVNQNQTISMIGGNIDIFNGTYLYDEHYNANIPVGSLTAPEGNINLVAIASTDEVLLKDNALDTSLIDKLGNVSISDYSWIDVSGEGAGNIFLRAEQININESIISGDTYGYKNAGAIDIFANKVSLINSQIGLLTNAVGNAGNIIIKANDTIEMSESIIYNMSYNFGNCGNISIDTKNLLVNNGSQIINSTQSFGNGGDITIQNCEHLNISGRDIFGQASLIHSLSGSADFNDGYGDAGNITIGNTTKISIQDGGQIATVTYTPGLAGTVSIMGADQIILRGMDQEGHSSTILSDSRNENIDNAGDAGDIRIQTKALLLLDGAKISTSSVGTGNGGNIKIVASDTITMAGCELYSGQGSTIFTDTLGKIHAGQAGNIEMTTNYLILNDGAQISSSSYGMGNSGSIFIKAAEEIKLSGMDQVKLDKQPSTILALTTDQAEAGEKSGIITLQTKRLFLVDNAIVATSSKGKADAGHIVAEVDEALLNNAKIYSSSMVPVLGGNAGTISINARQSIQLVNNATISTEALNAGGGTISILSDAFIHLIDSEITSSVHTGIDNGGDISISTNVVAMNHASINAKAYDGKGGNVHIDADYFIKSADSTINVKSLLGIDGSVLINSADFDMNKELSHFSPRFLNAEKWMQTPCYSRSGDRLSRFILSEREGIPFALDDFLASPLVIMPVKKNSRKKDIGYRYCIKAMKYYQKGDYCHAIQLWENAITLIGPDHENYSETVIYLADTYKTIGFQKKALSILNSTLPLVNQNHVHTKFLHYNCMGDIHLLKGDTQTAKFFFEKSKQYALLSKEAIAYACALNNMANYYAATGDLSKALEFYTHSLEQIKVCERENHTKTDLPFFYPLHVQLKSIVLINIARLNMINENIKSAVHSIKQAMLKIEQLHDSYDKLVDYISLSIIVQKIIKRYQLFDHHLIQIANQSLNKAILIAENQQNSRMLSYANGYLGQFYEIQGDEKKAKKLTRKALFQAQEAGYSEIVYRWQWQLGRLFAATNYIEKAMPMYSNAIRTLSPVRSQFYNGFRYKKNVFTDRIRPVYLELTDLLLKKARRVNLQKKETLIQARDTMEFLKQAEIADFYRDECLKKQKYKKFTLNNIPEKTALIYTISMPDRLVLLLTLGDTIKQVDLPVTALELKTTAKNFFLRLQSRSNELFRRQSRKLYKWLIEPVQSELKAHHVKILVIVPDGVLRLIPFSALLKGNQFLIEQYALVTIPAISLTEHTPLTKQDHRILINGLSSARQGYPPLKNVVKEIGYIQSIMKKNTLLHEKTYTLKNLTEQFSNDLYTMLHLATHGHFGKTPEETFLLTYDGKMPMNTLEHLIKTNRFHNPNIELLTLSACTTAIGDERAALGMAGAAIKAGVKSVIATLWQIDDEISSEIVKHFYNDYIKSDVSKAIALQNAQKKCIQNTKYSHPAYWAPFMLIGNWM